MFDNDFLYDRIYACWLGKNIGGTLGAPVEGKMCRLNVTSYPPLPDGRALPNDDLDLQLVALHALEAHGPRLGSNELAGEWLEHVYFPWDEYGYAATALRLGFTPPYSGSFDNHFTDCMGSPIRSELWAALCAGDPGLAASYAMRDALVDHAGGQGVWGEVFNAAAEAEAYNRDDIEQIISSALACIPPDCRVSRAVSLALGLWRGGKTLFDARDELLAACGSPNFTDAPQNIAFGLMGILWGDGFEDAILKTVNLGYDTDCTVATAGALLGIMLGRSGIPEKWSAPIGDKIEMSSQIRGFTPPDDLDDLTRRTLGQRARLMLHDRAAFLADTPSVSDIETQTAVFPGGALPGCGVVLTLRYIGQPTASRGAPCRVSFTLENNTGWQWVCRASLDCPTGFYAGEIGLLTVPAGGSTAFECEISTDLPPCEAHRINRVTLVLGRINDGSPWCDYRHTFTVLSPNIWHIDGKAMPVAGTTVRFPGRGAHVAGCVLDNPAGREAVLICNSPRPVALYLDGERVIDAPGALYLPAYHRSPASQRANITLGAGKHTIKIDIGSGDDDDGIFSFSVNAPRNVNEPGNHYAYNDIRLLPQDICDCKEGDIK